ncbi:MAG: FecR domain-containing protein [Bacteroidales bacterium]|nr:FecR domain-containing protein [Bacteroidales bacterium]
MNEEKIYEIIAAFLIGESSKEENELLFEWLNQSTENRHIFNELKIAWQYAFADRQQMLESRTLILKTILARVRKRRLFRPAAAIAAFVLATGLGFAIASAIFKPLEDPTPAPHEGLITMSTLPGQKAEATLSDGTKIWLNSGTTISYPASYGIEDRTATLVEGEIFLDVAKKEGQLFTLNTSNGYVKVHGTSFDARNYSADQSMTISLEKGSIEFYSSDRSSKAMMNPGQKLSLDKASGSMVLQKCGSEIESVWRFGELKIEKKSFLEVMADMERWYGVEIQVTGNIPKTNYFWMTVKTESLREMLGLLKKITPLTYEIDGKSVLITVK